MSGSRSVSGGVIGPNDFDNDAARWHAEIRYAEKECSDWWKKSREILARYRDERPGRNTVTDIQLGRHFNILWSNIQTLAPAIYAAAPDPVVQRRFSDEDDVARVASTILQRAIAYQLEENDFDQTARECVLDNLLAGRGTVWLRYEPHFGREPQIPPIRQQPMPAAVAGPGQPAVSGLSGGAMPMPTSVGMPASGPPPPPPGGPPGMPMPPGGLAPAPASVGLPAAPPGPGIPLPQPGTMPTPPPGPPEVEPLLSAAAGATIDIGDEGRVRPGGRPADGGVQVSNDGEGDGTGEFLAWEKCCIDHVGWEDWLSNPARTWAEVRWVARRVLMTKDEVKARFGRKLANEVPLAWHPSDLTEADALEPMNQIFCRAEVWEIWDKPSRKVIWIAKDYAEKVLDERDDPLRLPQFFPTPRPFYATLTTDTLIPVPDYIEYRDQALEIDNLTARIHAVAKAIKVAGTYDASQNEIVRMFTEGSENQLIPVNTWAQFAQAGGLKGSIDMLDISSMAETLEKLLAIRAQAKQDLYEVTGISDIIRGSTVASETATAQQIKSQFGTMRLRARQAEMARFCRDVVRLVGDVVAEHFQPRTLLMMSDIQHQPGQDAQLAPQAIALLKDEKTRPLQLDIETDSTIVADQQQEQQQRIAFLQMASQFLQQALPATTQYPAIAPLLGQMLLFGIRAFPKGAELEGAFESAIKAMAQAPAQAPAPDPKLMLAQAQVRNIDSQIADRQVDNQRADLEARHQLGLAGAKAANEAQHDRDANDRDTVKMLHDHEVDRRNVMLDAAKIALDHGLARQTAGQQKKGAA